MMCFRQQSRRWFQLASRVHHCHQKLLVVDKNCTICTTGREVLQVVYRVRSTNFYCRFISYLSTKNVVLSSIGENFSRTRELNSALTLTLRVHSKTNCRPPKIHMYTKAHGTGCIFAQNRSSTIALRVQLKNYLPKSKFLPNSCN
jgi:hypothetical protein